jgi:hypothetical protein
VVRPADGINIQLAFCKVAGRSQNKTPDRHFGDQNARQNLGASRVSRSCHDVVVTRIGCGGASGNMDAPKDRVWFVGDLDDRWVAAIADAIPAWLGANRVMGSGALPERLWDLGQAPEGGVTKGQATASRTKLTHGQNAPGSDRSRTATTIWYDPPASLA